MNIMNLFILNLYILSIHFISISMYNKLFIPMSGFPHILNHSLSTFVFAPITNTSLALSVLNLHILQGFFFSLIEVKVYSKISNAPHM